MYEKQYYFKSLYIVMNTTLVYFVFITLKMYMDFMGNLDGLI